MATVPAILVDSKASRRMLRRFDRATRRLRPFLFERLGFEADALIEDTRREYLALIPEVPWIGGRTNPLTWNLEGVAVWLAMWRVLKPRGWTPERAGRLFVDLMDAWLGTYPPRLMRLLGRLRLSRWRQAVLRRAAARSRQRLHEGDWVYDFVEGGPEFRFGIDYRECGIVEFLRAEGAAEIAPWMCELDVPMCRAFGIDLARTTTLAGGGARCDFRFRRAARGHVIRGAGAPPRTPA